MKGLFLCKYMQEAETHPNWFYDFYPMHGLVLGSFPPHQSKYSFPFYYPNKQNRFWKVVSLIVNLPLEVPLSDKERAIEERKAIMKKLKIGIHDVGLEIIRSNNSSLDSKIQIVKYQDIKSIVLNHPELKKIFLLGFAAKSSAARTFLNYLQSERIMAKFPLDFEIKAENIFLIFIDKRAIECVILNSTSSASTVALEQLKAQFEKHMKL